MYLVLTYIQNFILLFATTVVAQLALEKVFSFDLQLKNKSVASPVVSLVFGCKSFFVHVLYRVERYQSLEVAYLVMLIKWWEYWLNIGHR